jgi:hypothetical protein
VRRGRRLGRRSVCRAPTGLLHVGTAAAGERQLVAPYSGSLRPAIASKQFVDGVLALLDSVGVRISYAEPDGADSQFVKIDFFYNGLFNTPQLRELL